MKRHDQLGGEDLRVRVRARVRAGERGMVRVRIRVMVRVKYDQLGGVNLHTRIEDYATIIYGI